MSAADLDQMGNQINISLKTLNPANAAILTTVATADFFGALAVRPEDGVIFGGTGDQHMLFKISPITGLETLVGDTGATFIGDLAFQVPEPGTVLLVTAGLSLLCFRRRTG